MTDAEFVRFEESTIVRSTREPAWLPLARAANRALSALAPERAAAVAERLFLTPPRTRRPRAEVELLAGASARPMRVGSRRIETWTWGAGPRVLLVHGWGGRGAQLGALVAPLVARGFSVTAFDAPGHGASAGGGLVTIPEMTAAIREVAAGHGPVAGLVAHSLGAVTATRALYEGLDAGAAVYVGPAAELVGPSVWFTEALGFSRDVRERMHRRIERRVGRRWSAFDVKAMAPALDTPLLVVPDRGDAEVPWQHGDAIARAWRGAEFLMTDGLGHRRILRAPEVVDAAVAFLAARAGARVPRPDAELVEALPALAYPAGEERAMLELIDGALRRCTALARLPRTTAEVPGYPWSLVRTVTLLDGTAVRLRPIRPDDEPRLVALFGRLSPRTVYQRFFRAYDRLPDEWYRRFVNVDYRTRLALVAEERVGAARHLRAVARYEPGVAPGTTEIAIVVEDAWQGRGLGALLLDALLEAAEGRGITRFTADVLADNRRMIRLLARVAEIRGSELDSGVLTLELERRPVATAGLA
jgi:pimeloyl-ACP methyl ester carboxylesterase/RimJ/RimL family protein N-acetyltransferase